MRTQRSEGGYLGSLVVMMILALLLLAVGGFGIWAFVSRNDYKTNSDSKVKVAVNAALADQKTTLDKAYAENDKQPFATFTAPSEMGGLSFQYPKTWSVYADVRAGQSGGIPLDGYGHPGFVPSLSGETAFALRFQVLERTYDQVLKGYDSFVKNGSLKTAPFSPVKLPSVVGVRLDGQLNAKRKGVAVLLPLRDKTIVIWTEADSYTADFVTLLASINFVP